MYNGNSRNLNSGNWNSGDGNSGTRNRVYRNSGDGNRGNWSIKQSIIEQVSVEVDVEELARACFKEFNNNKYITFDELDPKIKDLWIINAKALNESKQKWLKLEVRK